MSENEKSEIGSQKPEKDILEKDIPKTSIFEGIPVDQIEIIRMKKNGGITIPKEIRDQFPEKAPFAFWKEGNKLIFQPISEEDVIALTNVTSQNKTNSKDPSKKTKKKQSKKSKSAAKSGPQPELTKYFPFQFPNQEKVAQFLENTFYKLTEAIADQQVNELKIDEAIKQLSYILINYSTGQSTNDSRLFNSIIIFIADVIEKMPYPEFSLLVQFTKEKLIPNMKSRFLKEQSLITTLITAAQIQQNDLMFDFLAEIYKGVAQYSDSDVYAIMQAFKGLINGLVKSGINLDESLKTNLRDEMHKYIVGYQITDEDSAQILMNHNALATDNALELIDLIEDLGLIEDAYNYAEELLQKLPPEDMNIENVRNKLSNLRKKPI